MDDLTIILLQTLNPKYLLVALQLIVNVLRRLVKYVGVVFGRDCTGCRLECLLKRTATCGTAC
jgi:hypothetical protein